MNKVQRTFKNRRVKKHGKKNTTNRKSNTIKKVERVTTFVADIATIGSFIAGLALLITGYIPIAPVKTRFSIYTPL